MLLISHLLLAAMIASSAPVVAPLTSDPCLFGTLYPLAEVSCRVPVTNDSSAPWTVSRAEVARKDVQVSGLPLSLPPGATKTLELVWQVGNNLGRQSVSIRMLAHEDKTGEVGSLWLHGEGFVYSLLDQAVEILELGSGKFDSQAARIVGLGSQDVPGFRVQRVLSAPKFASTRLSRDGQSLNVWRSDSSQENPHVGAILLATNNSQEPKIRIGVRAGLSSLGHSRNEDSEQARPGATIGPGHSKRSADEPGQNPPLAGMRAAADRPLKRATAALPATPPANPPGKGPVLRWSVSNEQSLYGYLIYRADHTDGPWRRVNGKIIPVLGHHDSASQYAWRDTSAVKGKTYWYFIKTLANDGSKEDLTEAQKVVAR